MSERGADFAAALVGRQAESAAVSALVEALAAGADVGDTPAAIVIQGPVGIGKTALWQAAVDEAVSSGLAVLVARPAEAEATFAYAALADLLRNELPALLPRLPRQQRATLELALGLADAAATTAAGSADPQLMATSLANALLVLAAERPVLIAIDDAPWLDGPTSAALQFAVRRIGSRPIAVIATQRVDEESLSPLGLDTAFASRPTIRLWLAPLSVGALHRLLEQHLDMTLPRPYLLRLHELSGGVPLHALEIARALGRGPLPPIGAPLPVPVSLRELLRERIRGLPTEAARMVLLTAAAGSLTLDAAGRLLGGHPGPAIDSAVDAGLLAVTGGQLRATHPLIASTAYGYATPSDVRRAHADLASVVDEPEAVARHRALSIEGADESIAAALETAGGRARQRGAPERAAELLRLAIERTPPADRAARDRRALALGEALYGAADLPAAGSVLDGLIGQVAAGPLLARARMIRSEVAWYTETAQDAVAHATAALALPGIDAAIRADLHYRLGIYYNYDAGASLAHTREAVALIEQQDRPSMLASALFMLFGSEVAVGSRPSMEMFERALAAEPADTPDSTTLPGIWYLAVDRPADARARFERILELDRRHGQLSSEPDLLTRLAEVELYSDNYAAAREYADAATALAHQQGEAQADPSRRVRALIDAHVGLLTEARAVAVPAADRAEASADHVIAAAWLVVLAFAAASAEDHEEVVRLSERSSGLFARIGVIEPLRLGLDHERLESLIALGRLDDAQALMGTQARRQATVPRPWLESALARANAALLAARERPEEAIAATDVALSTQGSVAWRRFDRARTLLVRGSLLRRQRARRDAAAALDESRSIFEAIGAMVWAARATAEAERLGRHRPGTEELTPAETQVAELAASGLTNREVAERLSVSPKTVEAHLARSYAKLGIRSRAELGRLMASRHA